MQHEKGNKNAPLYLPAIPPYKVLLWNQEPPKFYFSSYDINYIKDVQWNT